MEFNFNIDDIIPYEITVYDYNLNVINELSAFEEYDRPVLTREKKHRLSNVIDKIGAASAQSQGLKDVITSTRKFTMNDNHRIYLMKDFKNDDEDSISCLVGLLKIGKKTLFVHDSQGRHHEMFPLCILDFFIYTAQQRKGYGRKIFDFMLKHEKISPKHLAIDQPSDKSIRFLSKHYGLSAPIPQINKFVVYPGFFENREDITRLNRRDKIESFSAGNSFTNTSFNRNLAPMSSQLDSRKPPALSRNDLFYEKSNTTFNPQSRNSALENYPPFSSEQQRRDNNQLNAKQYSSPNLDKIPFPATISISKQNSINTTVNKYIPTSAPSPAPLVNLSNKIVSPIENRASSKAAAIQETDYERNMKNFSNNKYDPFPSLSAGAGSKPPIYTKNNSNVNQVPINIQKTYNQINKYSAFPSLEQNNQLYHRAAKIDPKPYDALFLDKYRKTKLW